MPAVIRVLVVDDSALIRQMLVRALTLDPRIEIVGTARTGVEAIEKARDMRPDVITLDIEMPELTGLEAIPHIRKVSDARIIMLSGIDDPDTTYKSLSLGAVDFMAKPSQGMASSLSELADTLIKKIKTAYRISPDRARRVQTEVLGRDEAGLQSPVPGPAVLQADSQVVAIAASTGGPPALERVFQGLYRSLPAAYLVVQHLPPGFSNSLAKRLSAVGDIEVVEGVENMRIQQGTAYLAPHGQHMVVAKNAEGDSVLRFIDVPAIHGVRPAADPLFESVARAYGGRAIGVVLTGMGSDGALGAARIRDRGGSIIVQDEPTSVVWGMPGAVVRLGAAEHVVPLGLVAVEVRRALRGKEAGAS